MHSRTLKRLGLAMIAGTFVGVAAFDALADEPTPPVPAPAEDKVYITTKVISKDGEVSTQQSVIDQPAGDHLIQGLGDFGIQVIASPEGGPRVIQFRSNDAEIGGPGGGGWRVSGEPGEMRVIRAQSFEELDALRRFDKDRDGKLSPEEQAAADAAKKEEAAKRSKLAAETLKKYDKDGDGKLSETERAAMSQDVQRMIEQLKGVETLIHVQKTEKNNQSSTVERDIQAYKMWQVVNRFGSMFVGRPSNAGVNSPAGGDARKTTVSPRLGNLPPVLPPPGAPGALPALPALPPNDGAKPGTTPGAGAPATPGIPGAPVTTTPVDADKKTTSSPRRGQ